MKLTESFIIAEPQERLWAFFEQAELVAACVPGVDSIEVLTQDDLHLRVSQSVGPMNATFQLKMRIVERQAPDLMKFVAIGRSVGGASGNVRNTSTVRLTTVADGTQVDLEADVALGGVLGSVGQKVVAKQAAKVISAFRDSLAEAIRTQGVLPAAPTAVAQAAQPVPTSAAVAAAPVAAGPVLVSDPFAGLDTPSSGPSPVAAVMVLSGAVTLLSIVVAALSAMIVRQARDGR